MVMAKEGEYLSERGNSYSAASEFDTSLLLNQQDLDLEQAAIMHPDRMPSMHEHFESQYPALIEQGVLWSHQKDAIDTFRALLDAHLANESPTLSVTLAHSMGLGKTVTVANLMKLCGVGQSDGTRKLRGAFFAPESHMIDNFIGRQDPEKLRGMALVAPELSVSRWTHQEHDTSGDVIAMSMQAIVKEVEKYTRGEESDFPFHELALFAVDEGDALLHGSTRTVFEKLRQGRISIAATGTPEQADGTSVFELYPESIGEIGFRESVEDYNVTKGRPVHFYTVSPGGSFTIEGLTASGNIRDEDFEKILSRENVRQFAVELASDYAGQGLQVVMYTHAGSKSAAARKIAQDLRETTIHAGTPDERLIVAESIGGYTDKSTATIAAFARREIDVLLSTRMGEAGLDAPHLNVVVCLAPTASKRRAFQRIGRLVHNSDEQSPLIVVFVAYDIEDTHSGLQKQQLMPQQLLDAPRGHGRIKPKPASLSRNTPEANTLYSYDLPGEIKQLIREQRQKFPFRLEQEFSLSAREAQARPGEYDIDYVAKMSGMDADYLKRILRAEKQYVSTRVINGEAVSFCDEAGLVHLDEVVSTNGQYSRQDIAAYLGHDLDTVRARITRSYRDARYVELYDRILRKSTVRKQRQYGREVLMKISQDLDNKASSKQIREITATEISEATGRDPVTVRAYFIKQGIARVQRRVKNIPGAVDCYELSEAQYARALTGLDLRNKEPFPQDGSYIQPSRLREYLSKHTLLSAADLFAMLPEEQFGIRTFRVHHFVIQGLPEAQFEPAVAYIRRKLGIQTHENRIPQQADTRSMLKRHCDSSNQVPIEAVAKLCNQSKQGVLDSAVSYGLPVHHGSNQSTLSYSDALFWIERRGNAKPLEAGHSVLDKRLVAGVVEDSSDVTKQDLRAIAERAGITIKYFCRKTKTLRVDDYISIKDKAQYQEVALTYFAEKAAAEEILVANGEAPKSTLRLTAATLAETYHLPKSIAATLGGFLLGRKTSEQDKNLANYIDTAIRQLNITVPAEGVLSLRQASRLLSRIVMLAEPDIAVAIRQDIAIRNARHDAQSKLDAPNAAQKQAAQYHTEHTAITEWATMDQMCERLDVPRQTLERALAECRARHHEVKRVFDTHGAQLALNHTLQQRLHTFIGKLRKSDRPS